MFTGFEKLVEERIRQAQKEGKFKNLPGSGKPLPAEQVTIPEDIRLAYKILKNADCLPPELEIKKEIKTTQDLLAAMPETADKYNTLKKLNFLIMKLNAMRKSSIEFEIPQEYMGTMTERFGSNAVDGRKKEND
jgi:hypothetical protein